MAGLTTARELMWRLGSVTASSTEIHCNYQGYNLVSEHNFTWQMPFVERKAKRNSCSQSYGNFERSSQIILH